MTMLKWTSISGSTDPSSLAHTNAPTRPAALISAPRRVEVVAATAAAANSTALVVVVGVGERGLARWKCEWVTHTHTKVEQEDAHLCRLGCRSLLLGGLGADFAQRFVRGGGRVEGGVAGGVGGGGSADIVC